MFKFVNLRSKPLTICLKNTLRSYSIRAFDDKRKAEEAIHALKEQHRQLLQLKKNLAEKQQELEKKLQDTTKKVEELQRDLTVKKK